MGNNCCLCKPKVETKVEYVEKIVYKDRPKYEKKDYDYDNLSKGLSGVTKEFTDEPSSASSESSDTSRWTGANPNHFEIFIWCGPKRRKLKVKQKYSVSKVINKFIELEKPDVEGKLLRDGKPLKPKDTLKELGISAEETLDLI